MNVEDWLAKSHSIFMSDSSISEWLHPSRRQSNTSDSSLPLSPSLANDLSSSSKPCPRSPDTGSLTGWLTTAPGLQIVSRGSDGYISDDDDTLLDDFSGLQIATTQGVSESTWLSRSPIKGSCDSQQSR